MIAIADIYWVLTAYPSSWRFDTTAYLSVFPRKLILLAGSEGTTGSCLPRWLLSASSAVKCSVPQTEEVDPGSHSSVTLLPGPSGWCTFWVTVLPGGQPSWWRSWVAGCSVYRVCVDPAASVSRCVQHRLYCLNFVPLVKTLISPWIAF